MVITNDDDPEQGRLAATHTFGRSEGSDLRILSSGHTSKGLKMIFDLTSRDLETSTIRDTIVEQASSQ